MNEKKTVLVTGATRGVGLAIADTLIRSGYTVIATGRKESAALAKLRASDPIAAERLRFMELELGDFSELHGFVKRLKAEHGPLWGLVNNAALAHDGVLPTLHEKHIEETVAVNVTGTILLTKYALRTMLPLRCGRVVNISSIVAHTGYSGLSVYAATKSAMIGFTRSLAREVGKVGITVNAIAPGYMETDMSAGLGEEQLASIRRRSPIGRLAQPEDVAGMVDFLLSEKSSGITGATHTVDAGTTA